MIDAQAVVTHLESLASLSFTEGNPEGIAWLQEDLQDFPVEHHRDAGGNDWFVLPGKTERSVVLGSYLELKPGSGPGSDSLDSRLGVVTGLETLKALARRFDKVPPCTLKLVVWPGSASAATAPSASSLASLLVDGGIHAYLELHTEPEGRPEHAETPLGVVAPSSTLGPVIFHPHLMTLCDEAIRELTGNSANLPAGPAPHAVEMARLGVPTAMMYVQSLQGPAEAARLHLLQAAEAFGRWTESTVHLVAGEEVDLWARERRVPHTAHETPASDN